MMSINQRPDLIRFSLTSLRRDWKSGELRLLAIALLIAVASVTSVSFFTDRIQRVMQHQAGELLGADLVLASSREFSDVFLEELRELPLQQVALMSFRSVVSTDKKMQLSEVKAVTEGYPLRGELRIADKLFGEARQTKNIPAVGEAWVEPRLLQTLNIRVGEQLQLGNLHLRVSQILDYEPDRGGDLFNIAPRLMINRADVAASGLILPGSRIKYRLLLAGRQDAIKAFRSEYAPVLPEGVSLLDVREARPELRAALERAEQFLGLAGIISVFLAGIAIATCARRFSLRHFDSSALMRCFGATRAQVTQIYLLELLYLGIIASLLGSGLGYLLQTVLAELMSGIVQGELPAPAMTPLFTGIAVGLISLLGFALPPLLQLQSVPPARVLRRDLLPASTPGLLITFSALAGIAAITLLHTGLSQLTLTMLAGIGGTMLILGLIASLLLYLIKNLRTSTSLSWRYGLANLVRHQRSSVVQTVALGTGLTVILILAIVRGDLLAGWQNRLPADAPNQFLINIQSTEVDAMRDFFIARQLPPPHFYPMIRGRLIRINERSVSAEDYSEARAKRLVTREFNLSWADSIQADNQIVEGDWWTPAEYGQSLFSVEQGIAKTLGIAPGDKLTYRIAEQLVTAEVSNLRSVEWDSFNVNFFVVAAPQLLENYPATWITSFYLDESNRTVLNQLVREFPSVTVLDVAAIMSQIRLIMERVTLAVEYVFLFTLLSGLMVMLAAIQSSHDQRLRETAILRLLGADNKRILMGLCAEFFTLGMLSGFVAACAATAVAWILSVHVFHIEYVANGMLWITGICSGIVGVVCVGLLGTRSVLTHSPITTLGKV